MSQSDDKILEPNSGTKGVEKMNLEEVKEKCTGVSIATINLGNEYSLTEEVKWLIERVERLEREVEYLENRKEEILVESGKRWTKLLKIRDIVGGEL